jgi:hypothetical protein
MRFGAYWKGRIKESFVKARVRAEAVAFVAFLIFGVIALCFINFPSDKIVWWSVFAAFVVTLLVEFCFITPYQRQNRQEQKHREEIDGITQERDGLQNQLEQLNQQPLTGIRLRNACDRWIKDAEAIIKRLGDEGAAAIPEAKQWLDEFPKFTAGNLPMADHDKCNYGNEAGETFHREKTKVDPTWEPKMYAAFVGRRAAMLMMFGGKLK